MKIANFIPISKLNKIDQEMRSGRLNNGATPCTNSTFSELNTWCSDYFGTFAPYIRMISPQVANCDPGEFTALGGWCAVRTKDFMLLKSGFLPDLSSGKLVKWTEPGEVVQWLKNAISIDQVVEAIGGCGSGEYVAISEVLMWTKRVVKAIEIKLSRDLSKREKQEIEDAIEMAEMKRFLCTKAYLQLLMQKRIEFRRVVDRDIWCALEDARADMCRLAGTDIDSLEKDTLYEANIRVAALMWAMYTGFYVERLKKLGLIRTQKALIVEPAQHAVAESPTAKRLVASVFSDSNAYLVPKGANANVGFAAFLEMMTGQGDRLRATYNIGQVPNLTNWQSFITNLRNDSLVLSPDVRENTAFCWGVNMGGVGNIPTMTACMNTIGDTYQDAVKNYAVSLSSNSRGSIRDFKTQLKYMYGPQLKKPSAELCDELLMVLGSIFNA